MNGTVNTLIVALNFTTLINDHDMMAWKRKDISLLEQCLYPSDNVFCRSFHNYLRITRMLVFLEEFGYAHYKRPFVEFVLQEAMEHGTLINTLESCKRFWIESIRIEEDRQHLRDYVNRMEASYASLNQKHNAELFGRADDMVKKSKDGSKENDHESLGNPEMMSKSEWREKVIEDK